MRWHGSWSWPHSRIELRVLPVRLPHGVVGTEATASLWRHSVSTKAQCLVNAYRKLSQNSPKGIRRKRYPEVRDSPHRQTGEESIPGLCVSWLRFVPSTFIDQTSQSPEPSELKVSLLPSGDQEAWLSVAKPSLILIILVPEEFIIQIWLKPSGAQSKAIFDPSGDHAVELPRPGPVTKWRLFEPSIFAIHISELMFS